MNCGWYSKGPIHDNFTPCWKTHLLRGEPDKMLRNLRHSKRSRDLCALSMESLVSGENHIVLKLVLQLCRLVIPLLNTYYRQSVPSQILLSITSGFVTSCFKQHCTFFARWAIELLHAPSISSGRKTTALWGNLSPL